MPLDSPPSGLLVRWKLATQAAADPRLSRVDLAALLVILDHMNNASGEAWPSAETVAAKTGASVRSVIRSRLRLVALGYLIETAERGKPNRYRIGTPDAYVTPDTVVAPDAHVIQPLTPVSPTPDMGVTRPLTPVSAEPAYRTNLKNQPKEPTKKKRARDTRSVVGDSVSELVDLELPSKLKREVWQAYVEHRHRMGKKKRLTKSSALVCIELLRKWAHQGYDPNEIALTSIANGWQGLFEPSKPPVQSLADKVRRAAEDFADYQFGSAPTVDAKTAATLNERAARRLGDL